MKDIFFGCSKEVVRYAYLRRNVEHMKKLYNQINISKLIIFHNDSKTNKLEVLLTKNKSKLALLDISNFKFFKDVLQKWLTYNINIEETVSKKSTIEYNKIDSELKDVSLFWLGIDDMQSISIKDDDCEMTGTPIYAIDITKYDKLTEFVNKELISNNKQFEFSQNVGDILKISNEEATTYAYSKTFIDFINKNNYCPSCAGHVIPVDLGSRLYCLNDSPYIEQIGKCNVNLRPNNLQFPRTDPCIIISLYDEKGRILLGSNTKRHSVARETKIDEKTGKSIEITKTFYSCFAGFMEPGETIEHCCIREVYEETGLKIKSNDIKIIESQPWPFPANLMIGCVGIVRKEESDDSKINIHLDNELDDVRWFNPNEVDDVLNKKRDGVLNETDEITEQWYCPPKESVAGRLIQHTVDDSSNLYGKF